ncbi:MAG: tRNA pseudouridine(38-40) synthase TruA [Bacilli bacterium]|nr:tRNA pseudouridine(38-40) synthase TruA [Bacilli bacterium]
MVIIRYLITFAYDGSNYNGLQKQPGLNTIQGVIESAIKKINNGKAVKIHASGRTDARVHAIVQKAHFDLDMNISCEKLRRAINSNIPKDIYINNVEVIDNKFHARYNVKAKEYVYKINMGTYNPMERNTVYQYNKRLNIMEMERALKFLEGKHDFSAFASKSELKNSCVRKLLLTHLIRRDDKIMLVFLGDGFLKYQVRNMVGTLIEIGEEKRKSEDIIEILKSKDRKQAGKRAKPEGLYLSNVLY